MGKRVNGFAGFCRLGMQAFSWRYWGAERRA